MSAKLRSGDKEDLRLDRAAGGAGIRPPAYLSGRFSRPVPSGTGAGALPVFPRYVGWPA